MRFRGSAMANKSRHWSVIIWGRSGVVGLGGHVAMLCVAGCLVTVGMGAVVAGLITTVPGLVMVSQYKGWVFIGWGVLKFGGMRIGAPAMPLVRLTLSKLGVSDTATHQSGGQSRQLGYTRNWRFFCLWYIEL